MDIETLKRGVAHPTIHGDYYKWLSSIKADSAEDRFRAATCPDFRQFHAIAMWAWTRSRETLKEDAKAAETQPPREPFIGAACPECGSKLVSCHIGTTCTNPTCYYVE